MDIVAIRLHRGEDVRAALERLVRERVWSAAFLVSAVGSLSEARLRFAGREDQSILRGDLEIIALSGTLSSAGVHLHAAVADAGGEVRGGHMLRGCIVRATVELVIGVAPCLTFARETDPRTGYRELVVTRSGTRGE